MADPVPFAVTIAATNGVVRVRVQGDLDCANAPRLGQLLADLADDPRDLVVDLCSTAFVDCAGIDAIAMTHDRRRQLGGRLVLDAPSRAARLVLELTGLGARIPTTGDENDGSVRTRP